MGRWYYVSDGSHEQRGPVPLDTLVLLIRDGVLRDESLVRREEGSQWHAADQHREILERLPFDKQQLVGTYLRASTQPEWPDGDWWAWEKLRRMIEAYPEVGWDLVQDLVRYAPSDRVLAHVAAGPLEDLLVQHGDLLIERVDAAAATDLKFRKCLACVWQNRMPDSLWAKVQAATRGQEPL